MPETSRYTVTIVRTMPSHAGSRGVASAKIPATASVMTARKADCTVK